MSGGVAIGIPGLPFRKRYAPAAAALLVAAGKAVAAKKSIKPTMLENDISTLLYREIAAARKCLDEDGSDILSCVLRNKVLTDPNDPLKLGETDFLFTYGPYPSEEDPSLVAEAKKLFGSGNSWAGKYVDSGVLRFVEAHVFVN